MTTLKENRGFSVEITSEHQLHCVFYSETDLIEVLKTAIHSWHNEEPIVRVSLAERIRTSFVADDFDITTTEDVKTAADLVKEA